MAYILIQKSDNQLIDVRDDNDFGHCNISPAFIVKEVKDKTMKQVWEEVNKTRSLSISNTGDVYTDIRANDDLRTIITDTKETDVTKLFETKDKSEVG